MQRRKEIEKEKSLFHELNKFRNLTNRVFFTLFSLSRLIKYHCVENEIIGYISIFFDEFSKPIELAKLINHKDVYKDVNTFVKNHPNIRKLK